MADVLVIDADIGDNDGSVSPPPATVPKKRGRPSNPEKPKKPVTTSGRGRGRPSKGNVVAKKSVKSSEDSGEEEGTASDGGSPLPNGDSADGVVSPGRGRPSKGIKPKITHNIEATGKGRGRPKRSIKADLADEEGEDDDGNDAEISDHKIAKNTSAKKSSKKGRGRPKKPQNSDDESSDDKMDDDEERRPVGRPPSGGVNLNIIRTGRGQGRPPKAAAKRVADSENGSDSAKKRGRPSSSGKGAYQPTGKPRGRPKAAEDDKESEDEGDAEAEAEEKAVENSEDEGDDKANSDSEDGI